jgi:amidohydrolase
MRNPKMTALACFIPLGLLIWAGQPAMLWGEGDTIGKQAGEVKRRIAVQYNQLEAFYKQLHANPELSLHEVQTAARLAKEIRSQGFEVTEKVGGTGIVAVLKNGTGPVVLVRTDMDALPVTERTGLSYASTVRVRDRSDHEVGVMHACGHDMHMTCWVGTARVLAELKDRWQGTLVFIGQPAEEIGSGARQMLVDGLFRRFPRPDYCLMLHCDSFKPYGSIAFTEGPALANAGAVEIVVKGKGGHGAAPHTTVDPIVLAARIVLDLQTLVSRETNPTDPAVVTVGSIHGGSKSNIIPSKVTLQLTVRSTKDSVHRHLLDGIRRIAEADARGANAPPPEVIVDSEEFTPALVNDAKLTRRIVATFTEVLGAEKVLERPPVLGADDFALYGREGIPIFMYSLGTVSPDRVTQAETGNGAPLPSLHSDLYYPIPEPSIKTGVLTMSMAVLSLLGR